MWMSFCPKISFSRRPQAEAPIPLTPQLNTVTTRDGLTVSSATYHEGSYWADSTTFVGSQREGTIQSSADILNVSADAPVRKKIDLNALSRNASLKGLRDSTKTILVLVV
jgi:hypothetical protein